MTDKEVDEILDKTLDKLMPRILDYMNWRYEQSRQLCKMLWPEDFEEAELC